MELLSDASSTLAISTRYDKARLMAGFVVSKERRESNSKSAREKGGASVKRRAPSGTSRLKETAQCVRMRSRLRAIAILLCDIITEMPADFGYYSSRRIQEEDIDMTAINIDKHNFEHEVIRSDKPVLLDFWASWCAPCRMVGPILEEIAAERPDIKVAKVNVNEQSELARQFGVMSIPSLIVMKEGKITNQAVGARPKEAFLALL